MWTTQDDIRGLGNIPFFVLGGLRVKKQIKEERRKVEAALREQAQHIEQRAQATTAAAQRGQEAVLRQSIRLVAGLVGIAVLVTLLPSRKG